MSRILCHFSCGAPSAVATKLALDKYGKDNCSILHIEILEEHPDNRRFLSDCERWFGKEITTVKNEKFNGSIYEVFKLGYLKSSKGAPCTTQLKRKVRALYQLPDDMHVFGYTAEETQRAEDFIDSYPELKTDWLLIENGLTRNDCLGILSRVGIDIPVMYRLGYNNNNCIGCVKGGMGYWNKIRVDFPEVFNRMAKLERQLGYALNKEDKKDENGKYVPVFLDELDPKRGNLHKEPAIDCSFFCEMAYNGFGA